MRKLSLILGVAATLGVSGCGYSTGERVLSGAGIGALGGAGIAAATHGNPLLGALVGGGVGAAAGAIVDYDRRHYYNHYYDGPPRRYRGRRGYYH